MSTRSEKVAITIATIALVTSGVALARRQVEIRMLTKIEEQLSYIKTAHRFADIVENFNTTEGETDDTDSPHGDPQGRASGPEQPDQEDGSGGD